MLSSTPHWINPFRVSMTRPTRKQAVIKRNRDRSSNDPKLATM
jgi:hypothetical protein